MTNPESTPLLPEVKECDLLALAAEEILSSSSTQQWEEFMRIDPVLAREVRKRAFFRSVEQGDRDGPLSTIEMQNIIRQETAFVFSALLAAARRCAEEAGLATEPDGVGDVA